MQKRKYSGSRRVKMFCIHDAFSTSFSIKIVLLFSAEKRSEIAVGKIIGDLQKMHLSTMFDPLSGEIETEYDNERLTNGQQTDKQKDRWMVEQTDQLMDWLVFRVHIKTKKHF